jgi:GT2 family glycosyltransferase
MYKVGIVILNWNGQKDTLECLESFKDIKSEKFTPLFVVVDNASADDSVIVLKKYLKKFKSQNVLLVNSENLGFSGGNNVGIKYAVDEGSDFVLVLNNDTYVEEHFLDELINAAEKDKKAGLLSPKIYFARGFEYHKERYKENELGKIIWYAGGTMDWNNVLGANYGVDDLDVGQYHKVTETDFATGACVLIRRETIEQTGYFDEKYFLYMEDADLSERAKKNGWKVLFVPEAKIWHKVSQSSGIGSALNDYYITRNRLLFGMKYAPLRAKLALLRESIRLFIGGREWQKRGVADFYLGKYGKGSYDK